LHSAIESKDTEALVPLVASG